MSRCRQEVSNKYATSWQEVVMELRKRHDRQQTQWTCPRQLVQST